jgi:hypothetical protein
MKRHFSHSPNPDMVTCPKCGAEYDPRVQSAACHKGVWHYPFGMAAAAIYAGDQA